MSETDSTYVEESDSYESDSTDMESIVSETDFIELLYSDEEHGQIELSSEEIDKKYFVATYKYIPEENNLLFVNRILPSTFFKYDKHVISRYFFWYSGMPMVKNPPVEIIQLHVLPDFTYVAVVKTYYIKIIQRAWKKIYRERQSYIYKRMILGTMRDYEIGKRSCNYSFPSIKNIGIR